MRRRAILLLSLGLNVALAVACFLITQRGLVERSAMPGTPEALSPASQPKTSVVVRRQFFSWQEVESADYRTYIKNLREIGCPERTIRDIIIADVNELYARKEATEVVTPGQQWWRAETDTNVVRAAQAKLDALDAERRALLTDLLGPDWEDVQIAVDAPPSRSGIVLDGPVLGALPDEVKEAVQDISTRSQEEVQAYLDAQRKAGRPPDPAELARLRKKTRDELARVLSSPQLEEFLLRYSQNAIDLRKELGELRYFDATADEFRRIFNAVDTFDLQIQLLAGKNDAAAVAQRKMLEQQRDAALGNALGRDRYSQFRLLHDPTYREAVALAQLNDTANAAGTLYEILQTVAQEQQRVRANTNLTPEQRAIELKRIELEQLRAQAQALGQELPPEPPRPVPPNRLHVINPGDSIFSVALFYGISLSSIYEANPGVDLRRLKPGDSLFIPPPAAAR